MKILGFLMKYVVVNLFFVALLTLGGISLLTGQFPPKISTIKEYVSKITDARKTYTDMVNRSNTAVHQQLGAEMALTPEQLENSRTALADLNENSAAYGEGQADQIRALNQKIMSLHAEIHRLQSENHSLRTSLNAK